jgi:Zn-dependent protease with chaperone function
VTLDRANRSFLAIVAIALSLGTFTLCGAVGGVLVPTIAARLSQGGHTALSDGAALLPALLLCALVAFALGLGGRSLVRQLRASRRLARVVRAQAATVSPALARAAARAGLGGRVVLFEAPDAFSFVYGVLSPRVAVSSGLIERASRLELRAVLEHERYHVHNLDPLKIVLVRASSAALFFVPALDSLRARYEAGRELAADRRAVASCGALPLAGALMQMLNAPSFSDLPVAAAVGGADLLDARVAQLETGSEPQAQALGVARIMLSLLGTALLVAAFLGAVSSLGGPAAVSQATSSGLIGATLPSSLCCTAVFAGAVLLACLPLAMCARR